VMLNLAISKTGEQIINLRSHLASIGTQSSK
jgi:hypothetical protein